MHLLAILLALGSGCGWASEGPDELLVSDAWMRLVPGGGGGSIYLTLHNGRSDADALLGATVPEAAVVEIHSMSVESGMMRMRKLDRIPIPGGEQIRLAPGGYHLMVMGLSGEVTLGDSLELTLEMESGAMQVSIPVRDAKAQG